MGLVAVGNQMTLRSAVLPPMLAGLGLLLLVGCSASGGNYDSLMAEREVAGARRDAFSICHGHGCRLRTQVALTELEWDAVDDLFADPAADARLERGRLAIAIGILESAVGPKAGPAEDRGGPFHALSGNAHSDHSPA